MRENREFTLEDAHVYDRSGPIRWVLSHVLRYPSFPLLVLGAALFNNLAYSAIQIFIGRGFDRIITPGWTMSSASWVREQEWWWGKWGGTYSRKNQ